MSDNSHSGGNSLLYMLAGFGLGAIVGAVAGLMFAPKEGKELRGDVANKAKELKTKTNEWVSEQKAKRQTLAGAAIESAEEVGA